MHGKDEAKLSISEVARPRGVTLPPGRAAEVIGVSVSGLKRRASEWGIETYWDRSGRRYLLRELEGAKQGLLDPVGPALVVLEFDSIRQYSISDGYGFIVRGWRGPKHPQITDRYFGPDLCGVREWIRERYGGGKYSLRLIDPERNLTRYKFILKIDGPPRVDDEAEPHREEEARELPGETPVETRTLRKRLVDAVKAAFQSVR